MSFFLTIVTVLFLSGLWAGIKALSASIENKKAERRFCKENGISRESLNQARVLMALHTLAGDDDGSA